MTSLSKFMTSRITSIDSHFYSLSIDVGHAAKTRSFDVFSHLAELTNLYFPFLPENFNLVEKIL